MIRATPLLKSALLKAARAMAKARKVPMKTISRAAYGDSGFFERIAGDGALTTDKYDQAMAYLSDPKNWPGGKVSPLVVDPLAALGKPK